MGNIIAKKKIKSLRIFGYRDDHGTDPCEVHMITHPFPVEGLEDLIIPSPTSAVTPVLPNNTPPDNVQLYCARYDYPPPSNGTGGFVEGALNVCNGDVLLLHSWDKCWGQMSNLRGEFGNVHKSYLLPVIAFQDNGRWYHGPLSKQATESLLTGAVNGSYLVRDSESQPGKMTLSVIGDGRVHHYHIHVDNLGKFHVNMERAFNSIYDLVQYHTIYPECLISRLLFPVTPESLSLRDRHLTCTDFVVLLMTSLLLETSRDRPESQHSSEKVSSERSSFALAATVNNSKMATL